jgi:anti-sigma factor RsiW
VCPPCAEEAAELAESAALLARAPEPSTDDGVVLARVLDVVVAERRRSRLRRTWLAAAAAAVLLFAIGGGVAVWRAEQHEEVVAEVSLAPVSSASTHVEVSVTGLEEDTRCTVRAVGRDGRTYDVVTWTVGYESVGHASGTASIAPSDVTGIQLVDAASGEVLATVPA